MPCAEEIVLEWLKFINEVLRLKPNNPLFPKTLVEVNSETLSFEARGLSKEHWANAQPVRKIFKKAFQAVGLPYFNPHLVRKTICKWGAEKSDAIRI
jgi:integrase/recombinase XerD